MRDIVVRHSTILTLLVLCFVVGDSLVVVLGVLGYDVPGVEEAGEVAEDAEEDVDA